MTKSYTVLLLRPDYMAENYGQDTYLTYVSAENVEAAQTAAQQEAAGIDAAFAGAQKDDNSIQSDDYAVLLVIEGLYNDIKKVD